MFCLQAQEYTEYTLCRGVGSPLPCAEGYLGYDIKLHSHQLYLCREVRHPTLNACRGFESKPWSEAPVLRFGNVEYPFRCPYSRVLCDPRVVVLVGVPSMGQIAICYNLLNLKPFNCGQTMNSGLFKNVTFKNLFI